MPMFNSVPTTAESITVYRFTQIRYNLLFYEHTVKDLGLVKTAMTCDKNPGINDRMWFKSMFIILHLYTHTHTHSVCRRCMWHNQSVRN